MIPDGGASPESIAQRTVVQPVHEYAYSFEDDSTPFSRCTHLGTDYGRQGPGENRISWEKVGSSGYVHVDLSTGGWAGMWHSLSGLAEERDRYLDFAKCYPNVRDEYQPRCVGLTIRVRGHGYLKLELKSANDRVLWWATRELSNDDDWQNLEFAWSPDDLRRVKFLDWVADPGARVDVDSVHLVMEMPAVPFEQRMFLEAYAKLARLYSPNLGSVRRYAHVRAGECDSVPATGLFCLATCAAFTMGIVKRVFAEQTLQKVNGAMSGVPRAKGLLPYFIRRYAGKYRVHHGTAYSVLATSIYQHSMFLAAQMLWDAKTLAGLARSVGQIDFSDLRDADGFILEGLMDDGVTPASQSFRHWSGEAVLALMLEYVATGSMVMQKLEGVGRVPEGVGCSAEIQSLFYPEFSSNELDAVTGVDWLAMRRSLLREQQAYFRDRWSKSAAARLGLYGLSAGVGPRGAGHVARGPKSPDNVELIHPHYVLMSGSVEDEPTHVYEVLQTMEAEGLIPPWGMVENFDKDLDAVPIMSSLTAAFECVGAYHLWARASGKRDYVYWAAEHCPFLWEAARVFYPFVNHW